MISGLVAVDVPHDGACLFHALGAQLGLTGQMLRAKLVSEMKLQKKTLFIQGTVLEDWVRWHSNKTVDEYTRAMAASHTWGGDIEIALVAQLYRRVVRVYVPTQNWKACKFLCQFVPEKQKHKFQSPLRVLYVNNSHFMALFLPLAEEA
jgi:hypothetical protein